MKEVASFSFLIPPN